jgi:hypothetical protein
MTQTVTSGRYALDAPVRRRSHRRRTGRWWLAGFLAVGVLASGAGMGVRWLTRDPAVVCPTDALQARAVNGLVTFAGWLNANHVGGYVGEVGWPSDSDQPEWTSLAQRWYSAADALGLPVSAWSAAGWPAEYPMAVYRHRSGSTRLDTAGPQAQVVEAHGTTGRYLRGVVLAGGSFGAADASTAFDSQHPGRYGYDYSYENADGYGYLAARGIRLVRLTMAWERVQPVPGGPLSEAEVQRLRRALGDAQHSHLRVLLDLHNYGRFALGTADGRRDLTLGTPDLPASSLADVWGRLVAALGTEPAMLGYDLLNEPTTLAERGPAGARLWEQVSQQAVDAVRAAGGTGVVAVTGYGKTSPNNWGDLHPRAWIHDPLDRTVYEAHAYFDADGSGHYAVSYADEVRRTGPAPAPGCQRLSGVATAGFGTE